MTVESDPLSFRNRGLLCSSCSHCFLFLSCVQLAIFCISRAKHSSCHETWRNSSMNPQSSRKGRVTSVTLAPHPHLNNLLTVVVTLQAEDTVKGTNTPSYTFRVCLFYGGLTREALLSAISCVFLVPPWREFRPTNRPEFRYPAALALFFCVRSLNAPTSQPRHICARGAICLMPSQGRLPNPSF
jgi:hypothetical protein